MGLDALISQLPANATFALDIGNDGVDDWSGTVINNSTNTNSNLAAPFNAYWASHGAPSSGTLDVPVKVTLSQPGQVLLTNLQVTTAGAKLRTVRTPVGIYTRFLLDFLVGGSGTVPLNVALDLGDNGSIDWTYSQTATLPMPIQTANLKDALNAYLAGKSGEVDVPLRFYVAPDHALTLTDFDAALTPTADPVAQTVAVAPMAVQAVPKPGDKLAVQATIKNQGTGSTGPLTAAFFATAEGWGDWYIGSAYIPDLASGASTPVAITWDTTGFQGDIPVKVVVNPYSDTPETDPDNNTALTSIFIEPPVLIAASFTATPTVGSAPLTVQFTDTSTGTVSSRTWDFGDNSTSATQHPSHRYAAAGFYTVTLAISGPDGSDTETKAAFIVASVPVPPVPNFTANPVTGNAPLTVQFADKSTGSISLRSWDFGDGGTVSGRMNPTHTYTAEGVYTVTLTASGPGGVATKTYPNLIAVAPNQVCVDVPLVVGWNLISLPVQPASTAPATVLAALNGKYDAVFAYDGCDATDPWKRFSPSAPPETNDLTSLTVTKGFWLRMSQSATFSVCGPPLPASTDIALCTGWNLTGYPASTTRSPGEALGAAASCANNLFGYAVADAADPWKRYSPGLPPELSDLTTLAPGGGYWFAAKQSCTWTVQK